MFILELTLRILNMHNVPQSQNLKFSMLNLYQKVQKVVIHVFIVDLLALNRDLLITKKLSVTDLSSKNVF